MVLVAKLFTSTIIAFSLSFLAAPQVFAQVPVTDDLFDVSAGTRVITRTPLHSTSDARNMFGYSYNSHFPTEVDNTLFDDRKPQGTVHTIEWVTATPVHLERFTLHARHDAIINRSISLFRFYAQQDDGTFTMVDDHAITSPYGGGVSNNELHYQKDVNLTSQRFKAEFVQHAHSSLSSGPRIVELDGFGTALPAPPPPATDDLFDISQGTTITNHSPIFNRQGQADARDLFGGEYTQITGFPNHTGQLLFADGLPQSTVHFVEWRTAQPVTLETLRLYAEHNAVAPNNPTEKRDANQRGFRRFTLLAQDQAGDWQSVYEYFPSNPYGQGQGEFFNQLTIERAVSAPAAQNFRAEFEQFGPAHASHSGPLLIELDGFGQVTETSTPPAILFIPGLKASRLYQPGTIFENKLWEPNISADVKKLFLDESGHSLNPDIYTQDVIDEAFGQNIYKSFLAFLDDLKTAGTISDWQTLPYDWRLANDSHAPAVITALQDLSATNPNITIITHSNGALVAKAALSKLVDQNDPLLEKIDRVIYVAAPHHGTPGAVAAAHHGTPGAVAAALHGYDQQLLGGFLLNAPTARELAEHMGSAFELFPSQTYFDSVLDPIITFDDSVEQLDVFSSTNDITTLDSLRQFVTGQGSDRTEPQAADIATPNILSGTLFDQAAADHEDYANLDLPDHIQTINIIGWGLDTIKGIHYKAKSTTVCTSRGECQEDHQLDLRPEFVLDGDETVINASSETSTSNNFYLNLYAFNKASLITHREHADLLEVKEISDLIVNNILGVNDTIPDFITTKKPEPDIEDRRLRISVHSPVTLSIQDDQDNRTGLMPNPNPDSDLQLIGQQIPNSYYFELGEGKYAGTNLQTNQTIQLQGTGFGTFDLEIQEVHGDQVSGETIFTDIPVSPQTKAKVEVTTGSPEKILQIDFNGDDTFDQSLSPGELVPPEAALKNLETIIHTLDLHQGTKQSILAHLRNAQKLITKGKAHPASVLLKNIHKSLARATNGGQISADISTGIRDILVTIQRQLES